MKIFENKSNSSNRSGNACGYCRNTGHNRSNCPHAPEDWAHFATHQIPMKTSAVSCNWYRIPKYWGTWYEECKKTVELQQHNAQKAKTKRATTRYCGFCGDARHTRRSCSEMQEFLKQCYKANENWRRAAYNILVKEHGIDIGAAVQVSETRWVGNGQEKATYIGLITSINWDSLNVMTAYDCGYDWERYAQHIDVRVMVDGKDRGLSLKDKLHGTSLSKIINKRNAQTGYYYQQLSLDKVIGKSAQPLKEEWVTSYKDAFDYLAKKLSLEQLEDRGILRHIQSWAIWS
jgi:hypothetical protein